jgi:beta-lactamase regulating signal transducer with metallopeptidase domain
VTAAANAAPKTSRLDANVVWFLVLVLPAIWGIWNSARAAIAARRVASEGKPIHDRDAQLLVTDLCRRLGWKRGIELRQSSCTPIPLCVGWRRPCVLLPPQWKSWAR